jgi:hypothetical protein
MTWLDVQRVRNINFEFRKDRLLISHETRRAASDHAVNNEISIALLRGKPFIKVGRIWSRIHGTIEMHYIHDRTCPDECSRF